MEEFKAFYAAQTHRRTERALVLLNSGDRIILSVTLHEIMQRKKKKTLTIGKGKPGKWL